VWQHDIGLARVETSPTYQLHLAQLEGPLDHRLCQNVQHQLHDSRQHWFGTNQTTKLKQAQHMASSCNNLVNATIQKNITIKNLVATNAVLTKAIADIQLSIARMCAAGIPTSPVPTAPTPMSEAHVCLSHWSNTKPAWDKVGYCWMHTYKVKVGHTSATCTLRNNGHQPGTVG
jgi:hypothetical protein